MKLKDNNWGFEGLNGESLITSDDSVQSNVVCDLWTPGACAWDRVRVCELYDDVVGERIYDIPFMVDGLANRVVWFHATNRCYTTKNGYSWMILKKLGYNPIVIFE